MKRRTITLIVVLVILVAATIIVLRQPGEMSGSGESGQRLADYDSSAADMVEVRQSTGITTLEKVDGTWMLTAPVRYKADSTAVMSMLNQGKRIQLRELVSSNPEKQTLFKVDSTGILVRISQKGTVVAAFYIGKSGPSYTETFVRRASSNDVYLADGYLAATFNRGARDLRDKSIFRADVAAVTNVTFHYGDTTFTLALRDTVWRIGEVPANDATVRSFVSTLSTLDADGFVDTAITLPKPVGLIEVLGTQIRFFPQPGGGNYFVQTSASPQVFTCPSWRGKPILKRKTDFLSPPA